MTPSTDTRNCECLAFWVDSEPCICGEPIGAPMEVSAKKLAEANRLVREVREIDRAMRFQTLVELSRTGVTSMASGYRPVVSA